MIPGESELTSSEIVEEVDSFDKCSSTTMAAPFDLAEAVDSPDGDSPATVPSKLLGERDSLE